MIIIFTLGSGVFTGYDSSGVSSYFNNQSAKYVGHEQTSIDWLDYAFSLLGFIGLGIGLPAGTSFFIQIIFSAWTVIINIIAVALVIQVIRAS